jgi:hypothetical protein
MPGICPHATSRLLGFVPRRYTDVKQLTMGWQGESGIDTG